MSPTGISEGNRDSSEAKAEATRRAEPRSGASQSSVACSGFTLPIDSQNKIRGNPWESLAGKCGIDWFELAACVHWDFTQSAGWFEEFEEAKFAAQESKRPATMQVGGDTIQIAKSGAGRGNDSHKEIQIIWNNARVGLSQRENPTRQLHNASLLVGGTACLVTGWGTCWEFFHRLIKTIGGKLSDEWLRRLDICIDLPNVDLSEELYPALRARQFVTTCRDRKYYERGERATGFAVGNSARLRVQIYDKFLDAFMNHDSVYLAAMQQRRWGEELPRGATRVEWQLGRAWLTQYGLDTATSALERLPDVFGKVSESFRITSSVPDRKNLHQSRAETHPLWQRIVDIGSETIGNVEEPLVRLNRSQLNEQRAVRQIVGFATSIADRRGTICETKADLLRLIDETLEGNDVTDDEIFEKFARKAKASGTWQSIFSFPGKEVA